MNFDFQGPAAIGIDPRGNRLYAVAFDVEDLFHPTVNDQRRFTGLHDFQDWWSSNDWAIPTRGCRVAIAADARDELGVVRWLQSQGVPADEFFPVYDPELDDQFCAWGFPRVYKRAFALAFYAHFRIQGPVVAELLWQELQKVESHLTELSARLGRLHQSLSHQYPS
jgi:hypothetical protein